MVCHYCCQIKHTNMVCHCCCQIKHKNMVCHCCCQIEYDLETSSKDDLRLSSSDRIEQSAIPTFMASHPPVTKESFIVTANDQVYRVVNRKVILNYYNNKSRFYIVNTLFLQTDVYIYIYVLFTVINSNVGKIFQYKFKLYNSTTKKCRQTSLGPCFGNPIQRYIIVGTNINLEHSLYTE